MKAAVLHQLGTVPVYEDFPDPIPQNEAQVVMEVKAASIKNLDKGRASGAHYASYTELPVVVGMDGVGVLPDGTRVWAQGVTGAIAEKAIVHSHRAVRIPAGLDYVTAAAIPNAVMGAAAALRLRAQMKQGDTVLINGATGVTGKIAVQLARHYGASHIIATGRNEHVLQQLKQLGATETISLLQDEAAIIARLKAIHATTPIDVVIDYLWGRPAELILASLKGGGLNAFTHPVKMVTVGGMAGESIHLHSSILRSADVQLLGSGLGSLSREMMDKLLTELLPDVFSLAAAGELKIDTETAALKEINTAWTHEVAPGSRLVITM